MCSSQRRVTDPTSASSGGGFVDDMGRIVGNLAIPFGLVTARHLIAGRKKDSKKDSAAAAAPSYSSAPPSRPASSRPRTAAAARRTTSAKTSATSPPRSRQLGTFRKSALGGSGSDGLSPGGLSPSYGGSAHHALVANEFNRMAREIADFLRVNGSNRNSRSSNGSSSSRRR